MFKFFFKLSAGNISVFLYSLDAKVTKLVRRTVRMFTFWSHLLFWH